MNDYTAKKEFIHEHFSEVAEGCTVSERSGCKGCWRKQNQGYGEWADCALSVSRNDGVLQFNCFKPSCDLGGGYVSDTRDEARIQRLSRRVGPLAAETPVRTGWSLDKLGDIGGAMPDDCKEWLRSVGISDQTCYDYGIEFCSHPRGIAFPITDQSTAIYGTRSKTIPVNIRTFSDGTLHFPKWVIVLPEQDHKLRDVFSNKGVVCTGPRFVVEDIPSALRFDGYARSVALLGTSIPESRLASTIRYLRSDSVGSDAGASGLYRSGSTSTIVIALDSDATEKAHAIQKQLRPFFKNVIVHESPNDPKYWSDDYVRQTIRTYS